MTMADMSPVRWWEWVRVPTVDSRSTQSLAAIIAALAFDEGKDPTS
jgi:hypothetical protein